ncbi:DUF1611 domain-containing protein [Thermodesulfobacteriota bacterium]
MNQMPEGHAIVYCEGSFNTPSGKTAHGLVRFTRRYRVAAIIDSRWAGQDAGAVLDGKPCGIPIVATLDQALQTAADQQAPATHFVMGLAPDGGRLGTGDRQQVILAIKSGLNVDCGLHDYLSEDSEVARLAKQNVIAVRDIRKPVPTKHLHFFSGKIEQISALKIAILGTDSAVGKRTTAWKIVQAFNQAGIRTEMIGTGQTAWMQGAAYCLILDSLVNDFVTGEIEHAVWSAWEEARAEVIVIEGQGGIMNPAYPGGYEILAAARPDVVILQHAPSRKEYDGFPGYPMHPLGRQIQLIELLSGKPVIAITINHEGLSDSQIPIVCDAVERITGLPTFDVLRDGTGELVSMLMPYTKREGAMQNDR